jgi:hypothetical protein
MPVIELAVDPARRWALGDEAVACMDSGLEEESSEREALGEEDS